MRLHLRGKSHRHAPAKMGAGSRSCANTLNESGKAHARGAWMGTDWNTCGVGELIAVSLPCVYSYEIHDDTAADYTVFQSAYSRVSPQRGSKPLPGPILFQRGLVTILY